MNDYKGNVHWRQQTLLTNINKLKYDLIINFENLNSEMQMLYKLLNIPDKYQTLDVLNPTGYIKTVDNAWNISTNILDYKTDWKCFYTKELQQIVYDKYKCDFVNFNYEFDLPE